MVIHDYMKSNSMNSDQVKLFDIFLDCLGCLLGRQPGCLPKMNQR